MRAPYWDWALDSDLPPCVGPSSHTINTPTGRRSVRNPLATYRFPRDALGGRFGSFNPEPSGGIAHCGSAARANRDLAQLNLRGMLYEGFVFAQSFEDISSNGGRGISIEQVHNNIHNTAACGNQLSQLTYAGFDPLFWLHHAMVDRAYAFWEATHPDQAVMTGSYRGGGEFTTPEGTTITPRSPLSPFFDGSGRRHTAQSVTARQNYGYGYEGLDFSLPREELRRQSTQLFNQLYSPGANNLLKKREESTHGKKIYLAHMSYDVEEMIERPVRISLYLCEKFMGEIDVLDMPLKGIQNAAVPLEKAIETCRRSGSSAKELLNGMAVRIITHTGKEIPLDKIPSMKMELEDMEYTPAKSIYEFPKISNRHTRPANLKQFLAKKIGKHERPGGGESSHKGGYGGEEEEGYGKNEGSEEKGYGGSKKESYGDSKKEGYGGSKKESYGDSKKKGYGSSESDY
ncbi:hypothetical protein CDD83_6104 [Cordyceps sp. RAO-2017]|nr:hypothetical protein CDD83_6104 [Cordyceps sp. RAO-2017]